jgi:hypothetical protein
MNCKEFQRDVKANNVLAFHDSNLTVHPDIAKVK